MEQNNVGVRTPGSDFYQYHTIMAQDHDRNHGQRHPLPSRPITTFLTEEPLPPTIELPHERQTTGRPPAHYADDEDSSSEMDVSLGSRSPSASPPPALKAPTPTGLKRKLNGDAMNEESALPQLVEEIVKRRRLSSASNTAQDSQSPVISVLSVADRLLPELWQQILSHLSPAMLCRCLRVSKTLNTILTKTKGQPLTKENRNKPRVMDSEHIWIQARKNFMSNMPRPLARFTELQMLQLIGGRDCQSCSRHFEPTQATTPFNGGPGPDGLRVVWPFGIRTCGPCFERDTIKDVEILVTAAAGLRLGLPYAFRTPDLHFVPEMVRQQPGGIPSHLRVAKVYHNTDVHSIQDEFTEAQALGTGAADEWRKGLFTKGKEAMADAARWEKWESMVHFGANMAQVLREYDPASFPRYLAEAQGRFTGVIGALAPSASNGTHALPQPVHVSQQVHPAFHQASYVPYSNQPHPAPRPARQLWEVEEARKARKADIERRCILLSPPLESNVLQYVEAFQAAMMIPTPMDDYQWEVLRPKILDQREHAEFREHQRAEQLAALQAAIPSGLVDDTYLKPAKEVYDREYEQYQDPLRKRLADYADDFINAQWHGGQGLDRDSSPSFAVQTLLHVHKRYLEEKQAGSLPLYGKAHYSKQGTPSPEPFLSLDNMKWVYDNKVRTLTDQYRRDLFICAGCAPERKPKWFAFEGLIQHYGAKHTSQFGRGNIVVHWQTAEWPEDPPFSVTPAPSIKLDRKGSDNKSTQRPRGNAQHADHESPFAPASARSFGASPGFMPPGFEPPQSFRPPESSVEIRYDAQLTKLSTDAHRVWEVLDGVTDMLDCIRVQTVLHHAIACFEEAFHTRPHLDLLTDALATHPLMRSIKNAHGLACKICVASQTDGSASHQSYMARVSALKTYNLSALITHFKIMHQPQEGTGPDWSSSMIELPETQLVSDLLARPGMDDNKLSLVAAAFPQTFPDPLPRIGEVKEAMIDVGPDSGLATRLLGRLHKKQNQGKRKKGQHGANGTRTNGSSQSPAPEPTENEYDPTKPMVMQEEDPEADAARFDTDIARKASAIPPPVPLSFSLAPETLAALSSLTALTDKPPAADDVRMERSPSVGRADPAYSVPAEENAAVVQPDITAILASLTQFQQPVQTSTPPALLSDRPASVARTHSTQAYAPYQTTPIPQRSASRQYSGHYVPEPNYRASVEPASAQYQADPTADLQATLMRNARQYEQAHHLPPTYVEQTQHPHQRSRSPPRYHYVYEDNALRPPIAYSSQPSHSQQPQQQPVYRQDQGLPAVQYIQLPASHHDPHQYQPQSQHRYHQYEQHAPQPKPIYVDEYGRPVQLIPISVDAAPAPVQYAPHPYDPQQYSRPAEQYRDMYYERGGQGQ